MEVMEVGRFTVSPFELERILELKIEKRINEHALLYLHGVIKEGEKDSAVSSVAEDTQVKFQVDGKVVFCGILKSVHVTCTDSVYYLDAVVVSNTILLDVTPMQRSFQEAGQEYKAIAQTVIKDEGAKMHFNAPVKKVENIILQYRETDWEFMKRLASHSNSVLIPVAESDKPEFHFGMYDAVEYKDKLDALHYVMGKDMELYRRLSQSTELNFTQEDSIVYLLKTDDMLYDTGDMLSLNGTALYVLRADLLLKDAILACHYTLATKKAVAASTVYNEAITGLMLSGKVIEVKEDRVKVHLAIDEAQEKEKAYEFPYATGYAAEGHTGWYVMPEVGDTVRVVFPEEDENHAYAAMSLRQAESDKTTDPEVKYLRTPNGKEIKLDKEEILITGKDGITFVKINENTGIEIKTDKPILVSSGDTVTLKSASNFTIDSGKRLTIKAEEAIDILCQGNSVKLETETSGIEVDSKKPIKVTGDDNIDITSKKKMKISSDDDFNLSTKKNLDVSAEENVKMICKENKVNLEGEGGLTIASAKPMKVSGDEGIDISSGKDLNASSGANFNLSADAKLALSAVSTLEASCNDSSISIDGDINLKAKLINEN